MNRRFLLSMCGIFCATASFLTLSGCATDSLDSNAGLGIENPAGAPPNTIVPATGTAGNGGGISGGEAGAAVSH